MWSIGLSMKAKEVRSFYPRAPHSCTQDNDDQTGGLSGCACCTPLIQSASRRITAGLSRRGFVAGMGASLAALGFVRRVDAEAEGLPPPIVLTNFRLFD